jgi:hypothetical protein
VQCNSGNGVKNVLCLRRQSEPIESFGNKLSYLISFNYFLCKKKQHGFIVQSYLIYAAGKVPFLYTILSGMPSDMVTFAGHFIINIFNNYIIFYAYVILMTRANAMCVIYKTQKG